MDNQPTPEQRPEPTAPASTPIPAPLPPVEPVPGAPAAPPSDGTMGGLIPYKNSSALIAYYLGVFSLVCGPFLGIPAFILGYIGLKYYHTHPEAKGRAHAWVGLILGGFWIILTIVIAFLILFNSGTSL